jgi:hypothetical protein
MNNMDIVIICNHVTCKYNRKEYFVNYGEQSMCKHPHPSIQFYGGVTGTICNSKHVFVPQYPTICAMCETQESDVCLACVHQKQKNKSNKL